MKPLGLKTHVWPDDFPPQEIYHDGKLYLHQKCAKCGRDFLREPDSTDWKAAHIGAFKIELLADSVSDRWVNEECPRRVLAANDGQRLRRN